MLKNSVLKLEFFVQSSFNLLI